MLNYLFSTSTESLMDAAQSISVMRKITIPVTSNTSKRRKDGGIEGKKQEAAMSFLIDFPLKLGILVEQGSRPG